MVRGLALQQWTNYYSNKDVPTCIYPLPLVLLLHINLILPDIVLSFVYRVSQHSHFSEAGIGAVDTLQLNNRRLIYVFNWLLAPQGLLGTMLEKSKSR